MFIIVHLEAGLLAKRDLQEYTLLNQMNEIEARVLAGKISLRKRERIHDQNQNQNLCQEHQLPPSLRAQHRYRISKRSSKISKELWKQATQWTRDITLKERIPISTQ